MKDKRELIRVVKTGSEFSLDFTGKKAGRGAYICPDAACLEQARKQKGLERSFKQAVPSEIYARLKDELTKDEAT
jgi:hypothetical protein